MIFEEALSGLFKHYVNKILLRLKNNLCLSLPNITEGYTISPPKITRFNSHIFLCYF